MVRRVEQDQDLVRAAFMGRLGSRYDRQRPKNRSASADAGGTESSLPIHDTLDHVIYQSQDRSAKLVRQVEVAMRVRKGDESSGGW